MWIAKEIYKRVIDLSPEQQMKVLNFVKELSKEKVENKEIDDAVERFIKKHRNALMELAKR
ncbi:hypothetical protein [Anaerocellum danielii]|uniref:Uncharacterized protein n=1 Tax=Anaerocellum danielii TaxID=1387557 RepID=A0ABZ0U1V0_9FIRM|nr:hypothetical protein [Caldicellulosiruptor danielii]WPX08175.1 hypothetical protein SOJ16_002041 [Caldicellulosiruptor danielii]